MNFTILLIFFFLSYMLISVNGISTYVCYDTGNLTANSSYGRNRDLVLSSLASNATEGFYYAAIGQKRDRVYALALCSGDISAKECFRCVNFTSQEIRTYCPNQKEAFMWGGPSGMLPGNLPGPTPCLVRYSNRSFSGIMEVDPQSVAHNKGDLTSDSSEFKKIWGNLTDGLAEKASKGTWIKYATGEANLTSFQTIYALMECTPDLSESDCNTCLQTYVDVYKNSYYGKKRVIVQGPNCIFRWEIYPFYNLTVAAPPSISTTTKDNKGGENNSRTIVIFVVAIITFLVFFTLAYVFLRKWKAMQYIRSKEGRNYVDEIESESLQFDFSTIKAATNDFPDDNKLGQGGFGAVYKGRLSNGLDIAVKRLSTNSGQGDVEFKNEVLLVAKLQHRNLVRLLGFCLERKERLLIYEFVPNSSLNNFIFDPIKREQLDWETRYKIIGGIARGILYLHEDSRLRIIHRDLKASNILLDVDMNAKISDFGMARLFEMDQTRGDTSRVVGTFGYMAPEYVKHGQFSVKSDVFSFGVLVLEIICGRKNSCFVYEEKTVDLLTFAWVNLKKGTALNLMDPTLRVGSTSEIIRCIHIGLLCVQENVASRPTMALVVVMLTSSSISLPVPSEPAFYMQYRADLNNSEITPSDQSRSRSIQLSENEVSITELEPR